MAPDTDRGLARRLQLQQGLVWLAASRGDPYAALLRGLDLDPQPHWRDLAREPLTRRTAGEWVTARHAVVGAVRATPGLLPRSPLPPGPDEVPINPEDLRKYAAQAWDTALADATGLVDLVDLAERAAIIVLSLLWGLDTGHSGLRAAVGTTAGALDAPFYAQNLPVTRRMTDGLAELAAMCPPTGAILDAAAGVPMATGLLAAAVVGYARAADTRADGWDSLLSGPEPAARVITETLRHSGPVQLEFAEARAGCVLAGQSVEAGDRVVSVLAAANRDPEVFRDPHRFDPDRPAAEQAAVLVPSWATGRPLLLARTCAEEGLRRLAAHRPAPVVSAMVRRTAAPVSRSLVTCPARLASIGRTG